jgi:protein-tyrosine kinase
MSRIEEALRRARTTAEPPSGPTQPDSPEPVDDLAVESPWSFDDQALERPAAPAAAQRRTPSRPSPPTAPRVETPPPSADQTQDSHMGVFGGFDQSVAERVIVSKDIPHVAVEQYRRLAATLHHTQIDRGIKLVMLTSAMTGEGKSLTATNLSLTLSQSYRRRVLLIDADLRRPAIHTIFQTPNAFGLSEALKSREERKLSIIEISERMSILTAGRPDPDPMSGLTSDRMRRILQEAAAKFDWVFIDTPPVALLPDAKLLAAMVDTAVLIVGANRTPFDLIQRALEAVGRDKIIGVVLNRAENAGVDDGHYLAYYEGYGRPR